MGLLLQNLAALLHNQPSPCSTLAVQRLMAQAFNNEPEFRRSRNSKPRTDLMVGGLRGGSAELGNPFSKNGLMAYVGARAMGTAVEECGPNDITIWTGEWWHGKKHCRLLIEVENNWDELRGTLRDLFSFQAKAKWGVFYHPDLSIGCQEACVAIREIQSQFAKDGFSENPETPYEIVVLPDLPLREPSFIGIEAVEIVFTSGGLPDVLKPTRVTI